MAQLTPKKEALTTKVIEVEERAKSGRADVGFLQREMGSAVASVHEAFRLLEGRMSMVNFPERLIIPTVREGQDGRSKCLPFIRHNLPSRR